MKANFNCAFGGRRNGREVNLDLGGDYWEEDEVGFGGMEKGFWRKEGDVEFGSGVEIGER